MKHTPGPWYVERDGNYPFMTTYICGADLGGRLADLHPPNVGGKSAIAANAELMATAPKLLEALEALSRSVEEAISSDPPRDWRESLADGLDLAKQVTKQAKGQYGG